MDNLHHQFTKFIELKDITVNSNGKVILNIPHLIIPADRITACIGPNGAGKTTLLKLIDGLIRPDTGSISNSFVDKTALVLHHTPMIKASARANLGLVRETNPSISHGDVDTIMERVGLEHLASNPAHQLSAGERQKLCLARAMLQKPSLVLLDEPTANLDPNSTEQVEKIMREFQQNGSEVLFSSHQLAQVKRLADYILFIDHGEVKEKGPAGPFFSNPKTEAARRYLQQELISQ